MIYLKKFDSHASYDTEINWGGVDISLPNVSYCKDVKDVHYTPYNLVRFYASEVTEPQTVKIYTDLNTSVDIEVSEGNKWYTYVLPKNKGLCKINGSAVKKVVVKADILIGNSDTIIPTSTVEASFKGSNTSNVTNMNSMFLGCSGLASLDISSFDTSNVTSMAYMFNSCKSLTSLVLSNFDTSNVTDMGGMFLYCSKLTSLNLSSFDTSKITSMNDMFNGCNGLTSLDLRNFNTSNVNYMINMFYGCSSLTSLTLSDWVISDATNTDNMFSGCNELKEIKMVGCNQTTIDKIKAVKPSGARIVTE